MSDRPRPPPPGSPPLTRCAALAAAALAAAAVVAAAAGLFLGNRSSLAQAAGLGVTHVLSAVNYDVRGELPAGVAWHHAQLEDDEGADLLACLPPAVAFLRAALGGGGADGAPPPAGRVLLHCDAGISRSAAIAAAYLMASAGLSADAALAAVRAAHPPASPNDGFLAQLALWGAMGGRLDAGSAGYRRFAMERVGRRWAEEGDVDESALAEAEDGSGASAGSAEAAAAASATLYRCRKCRQLLATSRNAIEAAATTGGGGIAERKFVGAHHATVGAPARASAHAQLPCCCYSRAASGRLARSAAAPVRPLFLTPSSLPLSLLPASSSVRARPAGGAGTGPGGGGVGGEASLFVEPMKWMHSAIAAGALAGKLHCPGCGSRLGSFNWSGITNTRRVHG
jgi:dual specificity phosphatase 12